MECFLPLFMRGLFSGFTEGSRNNDQLLVSHLLFTDDTLIFVEANPEHFCHLRSLFLCFEAAFGLKINLAKSKLVLVGAVKDVGGLTCILGCRVSTMPMKYLGLPLGLRLKQNQS